MRVKEKTNTIYFPMFNYKVEIIITPDILHSRRKRNEEIGEPFKDETSPAGLHSYNPDRNTSFIFLNLDTSMGTLTHECNHAIYRMFRWIGAQDVDEEIMSYTLGYLVQQVCDFLEGVKHSQS